MVEYDLGAALKCEGWFWGFLRPCADQRQQSHSGIPETAVDGDLSIVSAEDNRVEFGVLAVSAFFQEEGVCLAAASCSAV